MARYLKPGWFVTKVANPAVQLIITRLGVSPAGAHVLEVRGRKSGNPHSVPVNPLEVDGQRYLVAPRGETQWARNFRVSGEGTLRVGKREEQITGREVLDVDKPPILKAYLDRYHRQVGTQFDIAPDASVERYAEIAENHPVFLIDAKGRA